MATKNIPRPRWHRSRCAMSASRPWLQARPDVAGLETVRPTGRAALLFLGGRRRLFVVAGLGFRIEELAGGGKRLGGGILVLLTGRDVLAALDAVGFLGAARDRHVDGDLDLGMHGD